MSSKSVGSFVPNGGHPVSQQQQSPSAHSAKPAEQESDTAKSPRRMSDIMRLQANDVVRVDLGGGGHVE